MSFRKNKNLIFIAICVAFLPFFPAFSQKNILLKNEKISLLPKDYFIAKVIDGRNLKGNIGVIFNENLQKESVNLAGGVQNSVSNYLQKNLSQNKNLGAIFLIIKELSLFETKRNDGKIDGVCRLAVQFQKIVGGDTVKISEAKSSNNFTRSFNLTDEENYDRIIRQLLVSALQYFNQWLEKNSGKSEAFAKGSRIILLPDADKSDADTLYFSANRKLIWNDFQAKPAGNSRFAAAVFPSIGYEASFTVRNGLIEAQIRPKVYVVRGMSWVKNDARNEYALAHEQVHFNIAKIVFEHFKAKIQTIKAETVDELNSRIQYEYLEAFREMNKQQEAYDGETNHGLNEIPQRNWAEKVARELKNY